jgi:hypothetical protein
MALACQLQSDRIGGDSGRIGDIQGSINRLRVDDLLLSTWEGS